MKSVLVEERWSIGKLLFLKIQQEYKHELFFFLILSDVI